MVNLTETKSERDTSINLFSLSRPISLFEDQLEKTKNLILKLNPHASLFEFIEPFESSHATNQTITTTGKLTNKLNTAVNRSKPYTVNRPDKQCDKKSGHAGSNGTYHQTAILARLSSISNTFKSIFVRPKNTKHIQLDSVTASKTTKPPTDFKIKLFSTNSTNSSNGKFVHQKSSTLLEKKIEKIICDSVDTYSNSCGSSVVSTLSTTSNLTSDSLSLHSAAPTTKSNSLPVSKWTCMVCLSKHKMDVKVCSICGSQKQNQKFCIKQTNSGTTTLKTISSNHQQQHSTANYLKTWTCAYCSFANDSLKIVCMNCRSSKQMRHNADQLDHKVHLNLKRARRNHHNQQSQNTLNTSNEENELEQSVIKKPKKDTTSSDNNNKPPCMCKCNEDNSKVNTLSNKLFLAAADTSTTQLNLVTPTKPSNFYDTSKKSWTCSECLVNNDKDALVCVCCTTPREQQHKSDKTSDTAPVPLTQETSSDTKQDKKWKCETCLVLNDDEKRECVCCMTSRDNLQPSTKTKFSELVAAASGSMHSTNTNISFGVKTNGLSGPISFGSNFCVGDTKSGGFSFTNQQHIKQADKTNDDTTVSFSFGTNQPAKQLTVNEQNQSNINQSNAFGDNHAKTNNLFSSQALTTQSDKPVSISLFANSSNQAATSNESTKPTFCFANNTQSSSSTNTSSDNKDQNNPFATSTTNHTKPSSFSFLNSSHQKTTNNENINFGSTDTFNNNNNSSWTDSTNPFAPKSAEPAPSTTANATFSTALFSSNSQTKPCFSFGNSEVPQQQSSAFSSLTNCTNKTNSSFLFGSNDTPAKAAAAGTAATTLFGSVSSSSSLSSEPKATFSFGNNVAAAAAVKPTLFGCTSTETKSSEQPFVFGGQSEQPKSAQTPFNFGNPSSNFNFGCSSNPFASTCSTPSTRPAFGSLAPSTPTTTTSTAASATPFGFGAINQQNNVASPSLSQVLSAQTTPSTRVIKKPTRRLKK
ncbi:nuclear pore complex protein Nup153-like [Brachionus plicatilis]|uniref:Nuclear pore complex protein Nup153 n=1 Tax=Brachionus plicatilis TaxID=10195 RepID=A0A3M7R924_BRAPC|nr:nuclear pore complex protein Nup153-like [Brachionus plicatilis]